MTMNLLLKSQSLEHIYTRPEGGLNEFQREYFCKYVREILINPQFQNDTVRSILRFIWHGYDVGWHSVGRSPRSVLLEAAIEALDHGENERAKRFLSVLIAMYHDVEYINSHNWYDFQLEDFMDNGIHNIFNLAVIAILLDINTFPSVRELTSEDIYRMVRKN